MFTCDLHLSTIELDLLSVDYMYLFVEHICLLFLVDLLYVSFMMWIHLFVEYIWHYKQPIPFTKYKFHVHGEFSIGM